MYPKALRPHPRIDDGMHCRRHRLYNQHWHACKPTACWCFGSSQPVFAVPTSSPFIPLFFINTLFLYLILPFSNKFYFIRVGLLVELRITELPDIHMHLRVVTLLSWGNWLQKLAKPIIFEQSVLQTRFCSL